MKKWLILLILFATPVLAETPLNFTWTSNTDTTTGYHLWMDGGSGTPVATIEGRESSSFTYTLTDDGVPHAFSLTAFNATAESMQSAYAVYVPAAPAPLTFTGSFKLVQEP